MKILDNLEKYQSCFMPCTIKMCLENKKLGSKITEFEKRGILINKKCDTLSILRNGDLPIPRLGKWEVGITFLQFWEMCWFCTSKFENV